MVDRLGIEASPTDWKLVYRVLHAHLADHLELMDCQVFEDLQRRLQERAVGEGVDVSHHSAWDAWLGNTGAASCEDRVGRRRTLGGDAPGSG